MIVRPKGKPQVRFLASIKPDSEDKWRQFRLTREELPGVVLRTVTALEPEISDADAEVVEDDDTVADEP
jgi:hypothetical protein